MSDNAAKEVTAVLPNFYAPKMVALDQ